MKQQVLIIPGGNAYPSHEEYIKCLKKWMPNIERMRVKQSWKVAVQKELGADFELLTPNMPNASDAKYEEWKIVFEKVLNAVDDNVILLGHSLGGIFLAKYFAENKVEKKIKSVVLLAAPFDEEGAEDCESLGDFILPKSLAQFGEQVPSIYLLHSEDDPVVPFAHMAKYKKELPHATEIGFTDYMHFNRETFSELAELLREL